MPCSRSCFIGRRITTIGLFPAILLLAAGSAWADTTSVDVDPGGKSAAIGESLENQMRELEERLGEEMDAETTITTNRMGGAVKISHSPEDVVQIGNSIVIDADTEVRGDVVAMGGGVTVYGNVHGDVVAIGGNVKLHEGVLVLGDAVAIGGRVIRDDGAQVMGETVSIAPGVSAFFPWSVGGEPESLGHRIGKVLTGIIVSWLILFFFALIFAGLLARPTDRVGASIRHDPLKAGFAGLLVMVLSPFALIILAISIIGIPLIPVYIAMLVVAIIWGLVASALELGRGFGTRVYSDTSKPVVTAIVGIILLTLPKHLGKLLTAIGGPLHMIGWSVMVIGTLIVLLAIFIGLGAVLFTRFGRRDGTGAPPREIEEEAGRSNSPDGEGESGRSVEPV